MIQTYFLPTIVKLGESTSATAPTFTVNSTGYKKFILVFTIDSAAGGACSALLEINTDNTANHYYREYLRAQSNAVSCNVANNNILIDGNAAGYIITGEADIYIDQSSRVVSNARYCTGDATHLDTFTMSVRKVDATVTAITQIKLSISNADAGTFTLYGVKA